MQDKPNGRMTADITRGKSYDAIIIGAGHNGLVCANYLARAGLKVLILERRDIIGGAAVTEEIAPGFRASIFSYLMSLLHPRIIREFELKRFGLEVLPCSDMVSPLPGDDYILFSESMEKTQASFAKFSKHDAEIYPEFDRYLQDAANIVRKLLWETPVDPARRDWRTFKDGASFLWRYRKVGRKMYRIVDMLTMSAPSPGRRRRARPTSSCITSWASMRARAAGASSRAAWARSPRRWRPRRGRRALTS
jgi:phytoene dehydrogenase-like protein